MPSAGSTKWKAEPVLSGPGLMSYIRRRAAEHSDRLAVADAATQESLTYAALVTRVDEVAGTLRNDGVGPGDRVGVVAANSLPYVALLLALADIGAVAVPQNTRLTAGEIVDNLRDAGVQALVADRTFRKLAAEVQAAMGIGLRYALEDPDDEWRPVHVPETGWPRTGPRADPKAAPTAGDLCTLLYTSGTTGAAKGCMLPQRSWIGYAQNLAASFRLGQDDVYLAFLPFFHVAGLGTLFSQLVLGGTVVTQAAADPAQMHAAVQRYAVTVVFLVPGISQAFVAHPDGAGSSTIRMFISAAGLESDAVAKAASERFGAEYVGIYGQTESGTKTTWVTGDQLRRHPGTYGFVMPGLVYRIVDQDDNDVPPGEPGELVLRGSTLMQGYWNRPQDSAETLRNGWHHTGDVFVSEGDGLVRMVDRTKYLIKTGGENVYPQEVENVLKTHPDVADVAVIGIPDPRWGETVKAFVVPRGGADVSVSDLDAFVRGSIAGFKVPRFVEFVEMIPRNVSGKILKNELAARATDESQRVLTDRRS